MKVFSLKWQYTRMFIFTLIVTTVAIVFFAWSAYDSAKEIIRSKQLASNRQIITQIYQEIYQSKVDLNTMIMEIYENVQYLNQIEVIFDIEDETDDFFNNPFLKQQANEQFKSLMYNIPEVRLVLLYNEQSGLLISHNPGLNTWVIIDENEYASLLNDIENIANTDHAQRIKGISILYSEYDNLESYVVSSKLSSKENNLGKSHLMIVYDSLRIENIINEQSEKLEGNIYVFNRYGNIIYSASDMISEESITSSIDYNTAYNQLVNIEGESYELSNSGIYGEDFFTMALIPESTMVKKFIPTRSKIIMFSLIAILIVIIVDLFAIIAFGRKITTLIDAMVVVGKNNLDYRMPINNKSDEFEAIAIRFNMMCGQIEDYINQEYVYQLKEKNAELGYLQASINPHFLYNTLEAIRQFVDDEDNDREKAGEMITALATIFRNIVRKNFFITIKEEIELCEWILEMYRLRFYDISRFSIKCDKEVMKYGVIKNILQPMIENYFTHGIDQSRDNNYIRIDIRKEKEDIIFDVTDNGVGICEANLDSINERLKKTNDINKMHYGIANVNDRIRLVYGNDYGIVISRKEPFGTRVNIKIATKTVKELNEQMNISQSFLIG